MEVTINGEPREIPAGLTVEGLLRELGIDQGRVAVELNREIVKRAAWPERIVGPGARLEIVHFVGGG